MGRDPGTKSRREKASSQVTHKEGFHGNIKSTGFWTHRGDANAQEAPWEAAARAETGGSWAGAGPGQRGSVSGHARRALLLPMPHTSVCKRAHVLPAYAKRSSCEALVAQGTGWCSRTRDRPPAHPCCAATGGSLSPTGPGPVHLPVSLLSHEGCGHKPASKVSLQHRVALGALSLVALSE